ncbi:MAG: CDP-alcohol phosphatidyltransferase family protein [Bacilli bacterium]
MLDTKARKYVQPILEYVAKFFISKNISATKITFIALFLGLTSAMAIIIQLNLIAVILLWCSGFFDALDGTIARINNEKSKLGGFLDIVFDRIVEIAILLALCYTNHSLYVVVGFVLSAIILSMTIFLTSGNLITKESSKAFYYQTGLAERTEGFIMLSLAIIFKNYAVYVLVIFAIIILITAMQRFCQTYNFLKGENDD